MLPGIFRVRGWFVNSLKSGVFVGAMVFAAGAAQAVDLGYSGRAGVMLGGYQGDSTVRFTETVGGVSTSASARAAGDWEPAYGLPLGFSMAINEFFVDLGLELMQVTFDDDDLKRTDILLTGGYFIGDHWTGYVGFRKGMQGDSFFDDETFNEEGFFVGAAVGGIAAGPLMLGSSLAFNFSDVKDFPIEGENLGYDGFSLKVNGALASAPQHSLELRYQRFTGDDSVTFNGTGCFQAGDSCRIDYELTETYLQLSYIYRFVF